MTISPLQSAIGHMHLGLVMGRLFTGTRLASFRMVAGMADGIVVRATGMFARKRTLGPDPFEKPPHSVWEHTGMQFGLEGDHGKNNGLFREFAGSPSVCLLLLIGIFFSLGESPTCHLAWLRECRGFRFTHGVCQTQARPVRLSFRPYSWAKVLANLRRLLFDGFSHYQITQETVWSEDMPESKWTVAQARSDFFDCAPSSSPFHGWCYKSS